MEGIFQLRKDSLLIAPDTKIIRADELAAVVSIHNAVELAKLKAQEIEQKAQEDYQKRYDDGYIEGKMEGQMEYSEKLMDVALESLDALSAVEARLVDVVIESVRKILGAFNPDELTLKLIKHTLAQVRGEKRLVLRVSSQDEPNVRHDLKDYLISSDGRTGYIEVSADVSLKPHSCIIETSLGIVDSSLDSQLEQLQRIFKTQFVKD